MRMGEIEPRRTLERYENYGIGDGDLVREPGRYPLLSTKEADLGQSDSPASVSAAPDPRNSHMNHGLRAGCRRAIDRGA
jgi:hypothetical protein